MEWRRLRLWDLLHRVQNSPDGLRAGNLFVSRRERTEVPELLLKGLQPVLFVAARDGAGGADKVEVAAVDKPYKLQVGQVGSEFFIRSSGIV